MTNEQILKKVIEKAVKNGYIYLAEDDVNMIMMHFSNGLGGGNGLVPDKYYIIIYSHTFAKAFFADECNIEYYQSCIKCKQEYTWFTSKELAYNSKYCSDCGGKLEKKERKYEVKWEYYLSEMVLKKEPLKYLEKFISK